MKSHNIIKVIIGLSGGVDSAVSACLLKKQEYEVSAVYIQCWNEPGCRADQDREDALKVALALDLPFQVIDFSKQYKEQVLNYFYQEYKEGRTPNPDIICNKVIKFGLFYDWAIERGYDYVATGHYAKIITNYDPSTSLRTRLRITNEAQKQTSKAALRAPISLGKGEVFEPFPFQGKTPSPKDMADGFEFAAHPNNQQPTTNSYLAIPKDIHKDQTYFLYQIPKERLDHILFPLGNYLKSEVREIARHEQLPIADKPDSMGICFVGDINVPEFLKQKFGVMKGEVQLADGTVVGEHEGHFLFTVGKRGNWKRKSKIQNPKFKNNSLPKLYVIEIRLKDNVVVVGEREEAEKQEFRIKNLELNQKIIDKLFVRIRNTGDLLPARLTSIADDAWKVTLVKPEFGVSAGQSCVIYQKQAELYIIIGGGIIY